ncbi:baseplate J/gp47 family protein [Paenibacillus doosanensis]|uniref:Baseplate J-like protein n=1 Tax=Paenibacillus konkukensis TaxID=2020716 RepID=A0ABY4RNH3_9BACL|nr:MULTISPECIES: baseplate J/gp47 family protein [Paenibacillus]MCS7463377.1 baseplate J/gp47 family protein [Paenibacillus doosanensis]UQZ84024.1 Baseplate J-like protein [Paenibacillus konkukensis]
MAYEAQTQSAILQRMLAASPADIDKRQGSVTYDLLSPASIELALAYIELDQVLKLGFADTTYGPYLDLRCSEIGIERKPAVQASGRLTFTGANGTLIPKGTEVSTGGNTPVYFITVEECSISGGTAAAAAIAKLGGVSGNVPAGAVQLIFGPLSGVVKVSNPAAFNGGVDTETDADLLVRYTERLRRPATSGNANQYRQWAMELAGISDAKVYPVWNGNGTVKVVLLDAQKRAPSPSKVAEVASYIEAVRPVGAQVTVAPATEIAINVNGTYTLKPGSTLAEARTQIASGLAEYLKTLAFSDPIVRYSQIANVVLNTDAVADYASLTLNGGTTNITVADGSVAVPGTIT